MWRHLVLTITFLLFWSWNVTASHRSRRQASFSCESTETLIRAPLEYEANITCKEVIGRMADPYKLIYRSECQRWLGLSELPHSVANSYVDQCYEYSYNRSVKYKASVCCFGTTAEQRCFTCDNSTNTYECTYGGQVTSCPNGQVCMTQSKHYKRNSYSIGYRFAQCAPSDFCTLIAANNSKWCQPYIPSPNCTFCCNGTFCNYLKSDISLSAYDDACASHPCYHGGTCVLNSTLSRGYYCLCLANYTGYQCQSYSHYLTCYNGGLRSGYGANQLCYCPITKTGKQCQLNTTICSSSANYPCLNGGTCYNHTAFGSGLRCLCAPGWVGAHCEIEAKLECKADNGYYKYTYLYRSGSTAYNKQNCTYRTKLAETYRSSYLYKCRYHMRRDGVATFQEGVHGLVGRVDSISLYQCDIGDGLMRYAYHLCCPSCYSNPCLNGGWCQQDSNFDYVCQCRYGYEGRNCENKINMCIVSGDPHYKTIDGKQIHFQGVCKYNLVSRRGASSGLPDFSVLGKNERRGANDRVSYPSYFEVNYMNYTIKLKKGGLVTVNDDVVYPDRSFPPHFKITRNGLFTRFEASDGLIVDFDGSWIGLIRVPDTYRDKIHGLCGNYDNDPDNDMITSNKTITTSYSEVGNSWQVDDPEVMNCTGTNDDNPPICSEKMKKLVNTDDYCALLQNMSSVFSSCLKESPQMAQSFFESCQYDVCANEGNLTAAKEAACAILSSFATFCQSKKHFVLWRTKANCPITCPRGMVFKEKASACAATCERPDGPEKCSYPDTETCMCPDDMVLLNGTCQKPEMCTCPGGLQVGTSWLSVDCTTLYKCDVCKECPKRKVAKIYKEKHSCDKNEICTKINGSAQCQSCKVNGGWSSWSEWSDCDKKTTLQTRHRTCNNPAPKCQGQPCSGSSNETKKCDGPQPIEPNPPSCAPDFDFQEACGQCDLFANPNMFVANPCTCASYYQCSQDQVSGWYNVYEVTCGPCTCWDQDKLTCDLDLLQRNPNHDQCIEVTGSPEDIQYNDVYCSFGGRRYEAIPSDDKHYIDRDAGGVMMPCPPGTVFDVQYCQCILGQNGGGDKDPTMCLDFNNKHDPFKNNKGFYVSWSRYNTATVLDTGIEGLALRFNGDRLEIPAYNNKEISKLTISLWYKRDDGRSGNETLISNADCKQGGTASILIQSGVNNVRAGVHLNVFDNIQAESNKWHHVALTYDGDVLKFYVDGEIKGSSVLKQFTSRVQCPLLIGSLYDSSYFYGLMDQVCLYDEAISESQVKSNYRRVMGNIR